MPFSAQHSERRSALDTMGATASFACAVHCVVVALFLGAAPTLSLFAASWVDWAFLLASVLIGLGSLVPGYRLHRERRPLALFAIGISLLLGLRLMRMAPSLSEILVVALAAGSLIAAHCINRGAAHRCTCGREHH